MEMFKKKLTKKEIFENCDQNRDISKIFTKVDPLKDFSQNRDISKILTSIKVFQKFWPKSGYFENLDFNQDL